MREPYRTLFDGYENHWLLAPYLTGDEPDWEGLVAEERLECLSSGEMVLIAAAGAFAGDRTCSFAEVIHTLDRAHLIRIAQALLTVTR